MAQSGYSRSLGIPGQNGGTNGFVLRTHSGGEIRTPCLVAARDPDGILQSARQHTEQIRVIGIPGRARNCHVKLKILFHAIATAGYSPVDCLQSPLDLRHL